MRNYIQRAITDTIIEASTQYPIVTLTGPRQSGKSTLLKHIFPDYRYVNLENPDIRSFATNDPKGFIATYPDRIIIDEAQRVPELFSYLQTHVDEMDKMDKTGMYVLAGSQNFLLMHSVNQSLAGRTAVLNLLPFSRKELHLAGKLPQSIDSQIFTGFYPRLYDNDIKPARYYADYVQTYVERDVRNISRITDLNKFTKFIKLCVARIGQLLNVTSLATESGVSVPTAEGWLSILESSFILYRLEPDFVNYNKRLVKSPKLYFYDMGLACYLLGITKVEELEMSYMRGALFENMVINQFIKDAFNCGQRPTVSFWRDSQGTEIDLLVGNEPDRTAYEIKSGQTFNSSFFKGLDKWGALSNTPPERLKVIYCGTDRLMTSGGELLPFGELF